MSEPLLLRIIENDPGPVGTRKFPVSPFPRPYATMSLLCGYGPTMGSITLPRTMTADEWQMMLDWLAVMRKSVVSEDRP